MFDSLKPDKTYRSIFEIEIQKLANDGIKGMLIDLDNTLVPWRSDNPGLETIEWVERVKKAGMSVCLLSNAGKSRAVRTAAKLGIPVVAPAKKPLKMSYIEAMAITKTGADQTVMVGDQLFMDILGANRAGLMTVLVEPIGRREFAGTRVVRMIEQLILRRKP